MAFCNSCGALLGEGSNFCNKCGAAITSGASSSAGATSAPPARTGGSSGLKVVLIVIGAIFGILILCIATVAIIGYHYAKNSHVTQEGDHVKVDTPFGTFSANDPEQAMHEIGVDLYPGAQVQKNGAATATFGNVHTVAASFQSSDPFDKVCSFYKSRFPNSTVTTSDPRRCTIVATDVKNTITINVEDAGGGGSKFQITSVSKKPGSSDPGSSNPGSSN